MADNKKYYWLKLKEDFFDDKIVKYLKRLPDGNALVIIYLKMQLKSLKTEGLIKYDNLLPTYEEELSLILDEDVTLVRFAIGALEKIGAVERWEDDTLYMASMQQLIGSETAVAERVRRHRALKEKQDKTLPSNAEMLPSNSDVTNCNTEIEIEIEKELDIEKEKEIKKEKTQAMHACNDYNENEKTPWNKIQKLFGLQQRSPSAKEKEVVERWVNEWNFTDDLILEAYNRCIDSSGKYHISYVNKILEQFYTHSIKTIEHVNEFNARYKSKYEKRSDNNPSYNINEYEKWDMFN